MFNFNQQMNPRQMRRWGTGGNPVSNQGGAGNAAGSGTYGTWGGGQTGPSSGYDPWGRPVTSSAPTGWNGTGTNPNTQIGGTAGTWSNTPASAGGTGGGGPMPIQTGVGTNATSSTYGYGNPGYNPGYGAQNPTMLPPGSGGPGDPTGGPMVYGQNPNLGGAGATNPAFSGGNYGQGASVDPNLRRKLLQRLMMSIGGGYPGGNSGSSNYRG
jgi:hypothetical protein